MKIAYFCPVTNSNHGIESKIWYCNRCLTRFSLIYRINIGKINTIRVWRNLFKSCLFYSHCCRYRLWLHLVRTINFLSVLVDCQKYLGTNNTYLPHKLQQQPKFTSLIHLWGTFHVIYDIYEAYNFNDIKRVIFYLPRVIWNLRYKRLQYWLIGRQYNEINV